MKALLGALLALGIFVSPVSAHHHPGIEGQGACGSDRTQDGNTYYWTLHALADPQGALVDVTMWDDSWQEDRSHFYVAFMEPYEAAYGGRISVTENLGPTLWVRWSDEPETVFRFDSATFCPGDAPVVTYPPDGSLIPNGTHQPGTTPPPTSTEESIPANGPSLALVIGSVLFLVVVLAVFGNPRVRR